MHCPKCGQQQISEEVRFCSRCGFLLEGVTRLLAGGGLLPALPVEAAAPKAKHRGTRQGAKLVFWSVALSPIFFALCILADSPGPLIIPFTLFLVGVLRMLYVRLFGEDFLPVRRGHSPAQVAAYTPPQQQQRAALPPSQSAPVAGPFQPRATTAEIAQPPASVTEHTTRLLDDQ
jgi:hypothetical protein